MSTIRKYNYRDIDMLTAAEIIIDNAIANKDFLITKRPSWDNNFFESLKDEINKTIEKHLGKDAAKQLRESTIEINKIKETTLNFIGECKVQIDEDFKSNKIRRTEILKQLGFDTYYVTARKGINEDVVNLLYQFKKNLTAELKQEIVESGMSVTILDEIVNISEILKSKNITQETFKSTRKDITNEVIIAFNTIYEKIMSVANISKRFYKEDKVKQELFSISKIIASLSSSATKSNKKSSKTNNLPPLLDQNEDN